MGVIGEFSMDEFWVAEDVYEKMLNRMRDRTREIAIELGKVSAGWVTKDIKLTCDDDKAEVYVAATMIRPRNKMEIAKGVAEERVEFEFPMDWLFFEDYKEDYQNMMNSEETQNKKEYQEYLRLKAKFEKE